MNVSQKCQYALRAILELARRHSKDPVSVSEIAQIQAIPARFLELILCELRQGGFVVSRRGNQGGYILTADSAVLTVGKIIRFVDGPLAPVDCLAGKTATDCPLYGSCSFLAMWQKASDAVAGVYDQTTFRDLIRQEDAVRTEYVPSYSI